MSAGGIGKVRTHPAGGPGGTTGFRGVAAAGADKYPIMHGEAPGVHRAAVGRAGPRDAARGGEMAETLGGRRPARTPQVVGTRRVGAEELPRRANPNRGVEGRPSGSSACRSALFSLPTLPMLLESRSRFFGV